MNIPPPPPGALNERASSERDETDTPGGLDAHSVDDNNSPVVVFDLGASSPPQTPDVLDDDKSLGRVTILPASTGPPLANGDVSRRRKTGNQSMPSSLGQAASSGYITGTGSQGSLTGPSSAPVLSGPMSSWRASGRSSRNPDRTPVEEATKPSSRVGSPYYVEDPQSRVQTPFGSSHALTPLHMIDAENPSSKPSTTSRQPPEIFDGSYYQGMAPYDNAALPTATEAAIKAEIALKAAAAVTAVDDQPYDNCDRPMIADAAELIRARESAAALYEGSSLRGTPSSTRRTPGTPGSRRSTPATPASPRGTPVSLKPAAVRGRSASPRGTPASLADSASTPGSRGGTPVTVLSVDETKDSTEPTEVDVDEPDSKLQKTQSQDSTEEEEMATKASTGLGRRGLAGSRLIRQVPIPETGTVESFDDEEIENSLPQLRPSTSSTSKLSSGPMPPMTSKGPYFLPPGYRPLGAMSPPPRSAFTSVPPRDMRLYHPRPQRLSSGEPVPGMRPPYGVLGEPRRFNQPVVVYLNPNMQQSDSKISIYDNVQYVWSDQNPHHYQPYTQGDKTYCDV